ncbi:MAG: hypothetical protein U1G07_21370 [Verrucomicrobiota bacterium]
MVSAPEPVFAPPVPRVRPRQLPSHRDASGVSGRDSVRFQPGPIAIPARSWWREVRIRVLPIVIFLAAVVGAIWLWL